MGQMT